MGISHLLFQFFVVGCPPPGLRLYDRADGRLLAAQALPVSPATAFSYDIDALGLAEGTHTLGVSAVNVYGCESLQESIEVLIDSGGDASQSMINPSNLAADKRAGGVIGLVWDAVGDISSETVQVAPAEFEIALTSDLSTIIATIGFNATRVFGAELGPYADGTTVDANVRSSDGVVAGTRGAWYAFDSIDADAVGPPVPDIDEAAIDLGCGCS